MRVWVVGYEVLLEVDAWVDDEVGGCGRNYSFRCSIDYKIFMFAISADKRLLSVHLFGNWDIYIYTEYMYERMHFSRNLTFRPKNEHRKLGSESERMWNVCLPA